MEMVDIVYYGLELKTTGLIQSPAATCVQFCTNHVNWVSAHNGCAMMTAAHSPHTLSSV